MDSANFSTLGENAQDNSLTLGENGCACFFEDLHVPVEQRMPAVGDSRPAKTICRMSVVGLFDPEKCRDRRHGDHASAAPGSEAQAPACRAACSCGPSRSRPGIPRELGSRSQRLQSRRNQRRRCASADPNPRLFHVDNDQAGLGRGCRRRRGRSNCPLDQHGREARNLRCFPRFPPPAIDKARADIRAPRNFRNDRAGLRDLRQNPRTLLIAPAPPTFVPRDQCHPTHAVQLASLLKPT